MSKNDKLSETAKTVSRNDVPNRIVYVEPNDTAGHINDIPVTPDYTDFCISFDLIVDVVSRMRANSATISYPNKEVDKEDNANIEAMKTYVISWTSKYDPDAKKGNGNPNQVSFMGGVRYGDRDYLTTYYTDTHYNDFKNKTIVEGLGVESVNISFESYYAPTVKIRFIDVRGASIFGREEVLHTDEVLAEDNIWGCFFTFPYPKYRLQVKGFYGKAVTYQLCCTDFRANFNSQTGNYEIDMSFLGYDFGLLADIPMQYLIAAPYCHYANTMAFWNKESNSNPDWRMSDGRIPETFFEIKKKITAILEKYRSNENQEIPTEEYEETIVEGERKEVMDKMKPLVDAIYEYYYPKVDVFALKQYDIAIQNLNNNQVQFKASDAYLNTVGTGQTHIYDQQTNTLRVENERDKLLSRLRKLSPLYKEYKEKWPDMPLSKLQAMYLTYEESIDASTEVIKEQNNTTPVTNDLVPNGVSDIPPTTTQQTYNNQVLKGFNAQFEGVFYDQSLKLKFKTFYKVFNEDYETLNKVVISTRQIQSSKSYDRKKIQDMVGFLPNIGNVFRTLYCHLETFAHMIYTCADNIYSQKRAKERDFKKLGIPSLNLTDINVNSMSDDQIDPFPAIFTYKNSNEDNEGIDVEQDDVDDSVPVDAWIGELKGDRAVWEEEVLVDELFKALLHVKMEDGDTPANFRSTKYPVLPCDLNHENIAGIGLNITPDDLAGYLAIRAIALFGMSRYSEDDAEDIGRAEAINYFESVASKTTIKNKILDALNGDKAEALYKIAMCEGNYAETNKPMAFEKAENLNRFLKTNKKERHPVLFINQHGNLQYCYAEDLNYNAFIPVRLGAWSELNDNMIIYNGSADGSYYQFKTLEGPSSNILYRIHSDKLTDLIDETDKRFYINNEIFTIYYGGSYGDGKVIVDKVLSLYSSMKDGAVSLNGYTKDPDPNRFGKLITKYWKNVDLDEFQETYYKNLQSLYAPLSVYGVDLSEMGIQEDGTLKIPSDTKSTPWAKVMNQNVVFKGGSFKYKDKDVAVEDVKTLIPELRFYDENDTYINNVFLTEMYYKQNDFNNHYSNDTAFTWLSKPFACDAIKALLFLLTLDYISDSTPSYLNNNASGKIESVPLAISLFHGAILWRKRFYEKNGFDPILYSTNIKAIAKDEIPLVDYGNGKRNRGLIVNGSNKKYLKLSTLFGEDGMDPAIENKLIEKFLNFLENDWITIRDNCELKNKNGNPLTQTELNELKKNVVENLKKNISRQSYVGKYCYINKGDHGSIVGVFSENNPALDVIKNTYLSRVIVQRTVTHFTNDNGTVAIYPNSFKKYLTGFIKQIEDICNSETINTIQRNSDIDDNAEDRDIKRLIYMFIKNMWDRWFAGNSKDTFTVKNYMANTIFIDSMYRNVYTHIHINCEILESLLDETDGKSMVFKFLSDITTKHHCMYFAMPDYINLGDSNKDTAKKAMLSLFDPIPYSKIDKVRTFNRYIVMFTHKPSEINENSNSYKYDSFDIYSHDGNNTEILPTFSKQCISGGKLDNDHDLQCSRYGYNVPAFGVQFGRQNNAIFKRINVGMQNPVQTEQAINALSLIASRGRGQGERTIFYGQDLYNVYSGYSYTATVEMMGNAQIMPLMYFQLFNVPMFRGAYMIYSVTHTMKPGDMTTTVKAMKMSKRTLPWCQEWYAHYYFDSEGNIIDKEYDDMCGTIVDVNIDVDYSKDVLFKVVRYKFGDTYTNGKLYVNDKLLCYTLERHDPGYDNSDPNIKSEAASSKGKEAIQTGNYLLTRFHRKDATHDYYCGLINGIVGRDGVLIHDGSKPTDSTGCLLVGDKGKDGTLTYNKNRMFEVAEIIRLVNNNNNKCNIKFTRM